MGVCCRVHTGSAAPSGLYRLSSAAQRSGCRVGGMPTGYGQMAPKDLGSWILSFPPNKPKAEPWGNQGAAVTMQNRLQSEAWGRTPQPPHSRDTGRGEAATATFRWDQGWTPAAPRETPWACGRGPPPQQAPGPASSLSEDISGTPECDTRGRLLRVSVVPSTESRPPRDLAKTHRPIPPVTQSQKEGPLGGCRVPELEVHPANRELCSQNTGSREATGTPEPPKFGVGRFLSPL